MRSTLIIAMFSLLFTRALCAQDAEQPLAADAEADTVETKSPLGAVLRSAIVPGWGQFYNESYWKVPIVLGLGGFLAYGMIQEHDSYSEYADLYAASITEEAPAGNLRLKQFREFYRNRRDTYGWWLLVTYLLQLADAYVDAQLFNFDVSDEVQGTITPAPGGASLRLRF